jgi:hypothetical protein
MKKARLKTPIRGNGFLNVSARSCIFFPILEDVRCQSDMPRRSCGRGFFHMLCITLCLFVRISIFFCSTDVYLNVLHSLVPFFRCVIFEDDYNVAPDVCDTHKKVYVQEIVLLFRFRLYCIVTFSRFTYRPDSTASHSRRQLLSGSPPRKIRTSGMSKFFLCVCVCVCVSECECECVVTCIFN